MNKDTQISEPTAADLAFNEFRQIFPVINCRVALDGSYMNYKLPNLDSMMRNLKRAKEVITQQTLPLEVRGISDYCNHIVHIRYKA